MDDLKDYAEAQTNYGELRGHCAANTPFRPGIRERVMRQMDQSHKEASKAERLRELAVLLDKNPDIARILDLVEEVRG